jgi:hypothetical protein
MVVHRQERELHGRAAQILDRTGASIFAQAGGKGVHTSNDRLALDTQWYSSRASSERLLMHHEKW